MRNCLWKSRNLHNWNSKKNPGCLNDHHFPQLLTVQLTLLSNISRHVLIFTVLLCRSLILFYCLSFSVIPIQEHLIGELFLVLKWNIHFMIDYQIQLLMWGTQHSAWRSNQNVFNCMKTSGYCIGRWGYQSLRKQITLDLLILAISTYKLEFDWRQQLTMD